MADQEDDTTFRDTLRSFMRSQALDDRADYVSRGRQFQTLSDSELRVEWVKAYRAMVDHIGKKGIEEVKRYEGDLGHEMELRGIEPPFEEVTEAMDKFTATIHVAMEEMRRDPQAFEERDSSLMTDFATYLDKRAAPKN